MHHIMVTQVQDDTRATDSKRTYNGVHVCGRANKNESGNSKRVFSVTLSPIRIERCVADLFNRRGDGKSSISCQVPLHVHLTLLMEQDAKQGHVCRINRIRPWFRECLGLTPHEHVCRTLITTTLSQRQCDLARSTSFERHRLVKRLRGARAWPQRDQVERPAHHKL